MEILERSHRHERQESSNARFAMWLFLVAEAMFFAALIGMFIVLRFGAKSWKPAGFEEVSLALPVSNLTVLGLSAVFMFIAVRSLRRDDPAGLKAFLALALFSGIVFIAVQCWEFTRLHAMGLPLRNHLFGGVFYSIAGLHGVHVLGGIGLLGWVLANTFRGRYHRYRSLGIELASWYWYFVVCVWLILFGILYIG